MDKQPYYMNSPLAQLFASVAAKDEADRAIDFAQLSAKASETRCRRDAYAYALECIATCRDSGISYGEETLSHNIESNFPELDPDECDSIAMSAIAATQAKGE